MIDKLYSEQQGSFKKRTVLIFEMLADKKDRHLEEEIFSSGLILNLFTISLKCIILIKVCKLVVKWVTGMIENQNLKQKYIAVFEEEIYPLYKDIAGLVYLMCKDDHLTQDILQDTMEICWKNLDQIMDYRDIKSGVVKIAFHRLYRIKRMSQKYDMVFDGENILTSVSDQMNIEETVIKRESEKLCKVALRLVREDYQKIILLYYFYDLDLKTISQILQCNYNTAVSWHKRAKKELRHILRQFENINVY